jgi:hypothetical protein
VREHSKRTDAADGDSAEAGVARRRPNERAVAPATLGVPMWRAWEPEGAAEREPAPDVSAAHTAASGAAPPPAPPSPPPGSGVTIDDVASAAIDARGSGGTLDAGVRARVAPHLGADLSRVRVHHDANAQAASAAIGARAFAHGNDVFLGPGESGADVELMAHELTHVAQQGATATRAPLRQVTVGEPDSPAEAQANAVAARVVDNAPPSVLITDGPATSDVQLSRAQFLSELHAQVIATANDALGPFWSAAGCPYIERWFTQHANDDAATLDKMARRYSGLTAPQKARDFIAPICARLKSGIARWRDGGDVSADLQASGLAGPEASSLVPPPPGSAQPWRLDAAAPDRVARALGPGQPLDGGTRATMGALYGEDFGDVRVHTDVAAAARAAELDAAAFTVGRDIAFASGAYRPGTLEGDAVLAHELAHVAQQRDAAADARAQRQPIGDESSAAEGDADRAAVGVMTRLWSGGTRAARAVGEHVRPSLTTGLRLQRCHRTESLDELPGSNTPGQWQGKPVAKQHWANAYDSNTNDILAKSTLGYFDSEAAAIARITAGGKSGAVTFEDGKFVAYEASTDFKDIPDDFSAQTLDAPTIVTTYDVPQAMPGVSVLVSSRGVALRPSQLDPTAKAPQDVAPVPPEKSSLDPFSGYVAAFGKGGSLDDADDNTVLSAVDAALRDTALVVLARSEQEVLEKKKTFSADDTGKTGVSDIEAETMRHTAEELAKLDKEISDTSIIVEGLKPDISLPSTSTDPGSMPRIQLPSEIRAWVEASKKLEDLNRQRMLVLAQYPILARVTPADFIKLTNDQMVAQLASDLPGILEDIHKTRENVLNGQIELWALSQVVDATIAGLGIKSEAKQKLVKKRADDKAHDEKVDSIVRMVFNIGFGLAAAFIEGPVGLALAAGALGLSLYDALDQTNKYLVNKPASNTNIDPSQSLVDPKTVGHWGWLVVAWVGVGLDGAMVVGAVAKIAKNETTLAKAADELADQAAKAGSPMTREEILARLRAASGQIDPTLKIGEASRVALASRLGIGIEVDARLGSDVRIYYALEENTGRVRVIGMRVGPEAKVADILAHQEVLALMRRYEGLTGRVRELWDKMLSAKKLAPDAANPFPAKTQAYEAWFEVKKLPSLIKARTDRLSAGFAGVIKSEQEAQLRAEVEFLQNELAYNQAIVDQVVLEAGAGYIAKTGETTAEAGAKGFQLPDVFLADGKTPKLGPDITAADRTNSAYYYRRNEAGDGYTLVKKADKVGPSKRVELNPDGSFKGFAEGELTRAEKAQKILDGFSKENQEAFEALKTKQPEGTLVVPIQGMAATGETMADLVAELPNFREQLYDIILQALKRKGVAEAEDVAQKAVESLMSHKITVVKGTDQLRAFGYRARYLRVTGKAAADVDDLHHLIPLYLGGGHEIDHLIDIAEDLHKRLHDLIDTVPFRGDVPLAPGSIQNAPGLNFQQGAAIIKPDGTTELVPF